MLWNIVTIFFLAYMYRILYNIIICALIRGNIGVLFFIVTFYIRFYESLKIIARLIIVIAVYF